MKKVLVVMSLAFLGCVAPEADEELASSSMPLLRHGPAQALVAGGGHACALLRDGTLRCWGGN